jgi:hypothetical protein
MLWNELAIQVTQPGVRLRAFEFSNVPAIQNYAVQAYEALDPATVWGEWAALFCISALAPRVLFSGCGHIGFLPRLSAWNPFFTNAHNWCARLQLGSNHSTVNLDVAPQPPQTTLTYYVQYGRLVLHRRVGPAHVCGTLDSGVTSVGISVEMLSVRLLHAVRLLCLKVLYAESLS